MIVERKFLKTNKYTKPVISFIISNSKDFELDFILNIVNKNLLDRINIIIPYGYRYKYSFNMKLLDEGYEIIFDKLEYKKPNYIIYKVFRQEKVINCYETTSIEQYKI